MGDDCAQLYINGVTHPLNDTWFEDGRPTSFHSANAQKPNTPFLVRALFDPPANRANVPLSAALTSRRPCWKRVMPVGKWTSST